MASNRDKTVVKKMYKDFCYLMYPIPDHLLCFHRDMQRPVKLTPLI